MTPRTRSIFSEGAATIKKRGASLCAIAGLAAVFAGATAASASAAGFEAASMALSSTQAGAHADLITDFTIPRTEAGYLKWYMRDVHVSLPPGFSGNPALFAQCTQEALMLGHCPKSAEIGKLELTIQFIPGIVVLWNLGLYNLSHGPDVAAQFGANAYTAFAGLKVKVRSGDYGLDTFSLSNPDQVAILEARTILWGVPADHNGSGDPRVPFMTNPSVCGRGLAGSLMVNSWQFPEDFATAEPSLGQLTGCEDLPPLLPRLSVAPTAGIADAPSAYDIDLKVPQDENPDGVGTPPVKDLTFEFPQGVVLSPAAAQGLQACTDAQLAVGTEAEPACPEAAKVGTVTIATPAFKEPLEGAMYVGAPQPGHRFRLFLVAKGPGVLLKLRGEATPDPSTGQVTTTFDDNPQLPFSELQVHLKGGSHALLSNPMGCGTFTTAATLDPYGGGSDATAQSSFPISLDGRGAACPAAMPFTPGFSAGVTDVSAGGYSTFVLRVTREDRQQELGAIEDVHFPPGLVANVRSVPLCDAANAAAGTCPSGSQIGEVIAGAGAGESPLYLKGKVFLTTAYNGGQYGLSIVVPAIAGPYDLGDVVVRAAVKVNPDATISIDSDPLPTILDGVPLRLRDVYLNIDRPGFVLNPTGCGAMSVGATLASTQGASAAVSNAFQVRECEKLAFKPSFRASTSAKTSRANGASLHVKIAYPGNAGEANLRSVKVKLPHQLPSRIGTLQKACPDTVFDVNPSACPVASKVGTASVTTPILPVKMSGPVYFVSHGIAKFPDLVLLLQGEGITIELRGETYIGNGGVTSTTFRSVPDVPIGTFEMSLPQGPYSALTNNGSLCKRPLVMPTAMTAQNGRTIHQNTRIAVSGCAAHKARHARHRKR